MLNEIGSIAQRPGFIKRVKAGEGRLMGFGHRVYKSYDPRAKIIKRIADLVFDVTGKNPLLDIALELERIALEDEYFVTRKLYPNVDFYSGLIYQAMGFPVDMFPVLFAIPRTAGWIAQWEEMLLDPEQKIARPRQIYVGPTNASDYVPGRTNGDEPRQRLSGLGFAAASRLVALHGVASARSRPPCRSSTAPRAFEDLRQMVAIGPRPPARRRSSRTRDVHQEAARGRRPDGRGAGVRRADAARPDPHGQPERDAPGHADGHGRIVIGGHYDTKLFRTSRSSARATAASSAAFLLELARALKGRRNALPIELLFLDGEEAVDWNWDDGHRSHLRQPPLRARREEGRHGSRTSARSSCVDMIGDRDLGIRREQQLDAVADRCDLERRAGASSRREFLERRRRSKTTTCEFLEAGMPSVDMIDLDYPPGTAPTIAATTCRRSLQAVATSSRRAAGHRSRS